MSRGRKYTEEEKEFLRENYKSQGREETARLFEQKFGRRIKAQTLGAYCNDFLGMYMTKEEHYRTQTKPIGYMFENVRGEVLVKTEDGWKNAKRMNVDVPDGMMCFNLDGDRWNNAPENIGITTNAKFRALRNYGMWSENREITRTGLLWIDLREELIKTGGMKREEDNR